MEQEVQKGGAYSAEAELQTRPPAGSAGGVSLTGLLFDTIAAETDRRRRGLGGG